MRHNHKIIPGGITAVEGISAAGTAAGIKKNKRPDMALIYSSRPCVAAAVFTKNRCAASSIAVNKIHLRTGQGQAIIVNSGNANAATGARGLADTQTMAKITADCLGLPIRSVYVASTGVIGASLPMDKIRKAIPRLAASLSRANGRAAAEAIMTTDTFVKEIALAGTVGRDKIRIGGMAKGSGMIHPNMATMLVFLATDANIAPDLLQAALCEASDRTFNCITVDGETSTNDLVLLFATGCTGARIDTRGTAYQQFVALLTAACLKLAQDIVKDGEGATKFIEIRVLGARQDQAARRIALSVARSSLVKTAFFGQDANWGRIVAAMGNAGTPIDLQTLDLLFGKTPILRGGLYQGAKAEALASAHLTRREILLTLNLHEGEGKATVWTSDLSNRYIQINAAYRS